MCHFNLCLPFWGATILKGRSDELPKPVLDNEERYLSNAKLTLTLILTLNLFLILFL